MGPVIQVILQFDAPFWEAINGGRLRNASVLHSPVTTFPTFWTQLPLRAAVLSAWTAGSNAACLSTASDDELITKAHGSLEALFGCRVSAG
jgi:monoamine oxidase